MQLYRHHGAHARRCLLQRSACELANARTAERLGPQIHVDARGMLPLRTEYGGRPLEQKERLTACNDVLADYDAVCRPT